jgi:hypothetical protein
MVRANKEECQQANQDGLKNQQDREVFSSVARQLASYEAAIAGLRKDVDELKNSLTALLTRFSIPNPNRLMISEPADHQESENAPRRGKGKGKEKGKGKVAISSKRDYMLERVVRDPSQADEIRNSYMSARRNSEIFSRTSSETTNDLHHHLSSNFT